MAMNAVDKKVNAVKLIFKVEKFDNDNEAHKGLTSFKDGDETKVFANLDQFKDAFTFKALQELQKNLGIYIEALAESESKKEAEAAELKEKRIQSFIAVASLEDQFIGQDLENEAVKKQVRERAESLYKNAFESTKTSTSASPRKERAEAATYKFYGLQGKVIEKKLTRPTTDFKSAMEKAGVSDQWKLIHQDSVADFLAAEKAKPSVSKDKMKVYNDYFDARNVEELLAKLK